jgi:hypothetical protein
MSMIEEAPRCLEDHGEGTCQGEVDYHWNGDPSGKAWPRCAKHQEAREERRENSMELYANSDVIPDWFDPSYAGERWEED